MLHMFKTLSKPSNRKGEDGLTMIELLTTIAVLGIVTAIASPIIISMIQQAQIDAYKGELSYVSDSTGKMVNGTFGQPWKAIVEPNHEGSPISLQTLGARLDSSTGNVLTGNSLGYWYDIGEISLPFTVDNATARVIWENSRIVRVVPRDADGNLLTGDPNEIISDVCITAWVGDRNLVLSSLRGSSEVTENDVAPCGLIPGPIEPASAPGAPQSLEPRGSDATSDLVVSLMADPDSLGGDSSNIAISEWRVTCTSGTETIRATNASKTVTVSGLTRGNEYSCTAAVATNAYPGFGPESAASSTIKIPEAPNAPTALAGTGSGGQIALTWTTPTYNGCNDGSSSHSCGTGFAIQDYEIQYIIGVEGTDPTTLTDTDFATADIIKIGSANTNFNLSNANITNYNTVNAATLTQLVDGNTYYVRARAVSGNNDIVLQGAWGVPIVEKTATPPDAVTDPTGEDGTNQVTIKFNVPYNGGLAIERYELWYDIENTFDSGGTNHTGPSGAGQPLGRAIVVCSDTNDANHNATVCGKTEGQEISIVIDTLPDSTSYFARIFTENPMGLSGWSKTATADPYNLPVATFAPAEAPSGTDATIDDSGNATVTWD